MEKSDKPSKDAAPARSSIGHAAKPAAAQAASGHGKPGGTQNLPKAAQKPHSKDYRGIVRILGKDIEGFWPLERALVRVRGVGVNLARVLSIAIEKDLKISPKNDVGELSEEQLLAVESVIKNPQNHGVSAYSLNRVSDPYDGASKHLLTSDLGFAQKQDTQRDVETKSYKGWRKQLGQRVRGQRSRTTNRAGIAVGVLKKALKQQKTAAPAEGAEKKGKK